MEEIWKDIYGYEELYQVSNLGRVKSLNYNHTRKEHILKPRKDKDGYLRINLYKDEKRKTMFVHRLVAQTFIPNDDLFKTQINHKDENKGNNNINNLEWCDATYNSNYGTRNERNSKSNINHPKKSKQISQYSLDGVFLKTWESTMQIERETSFAHSFISACCKGKYQKAYGCIWKYA